MPLAFIGMGEHLLRTILEAAARGRFPAPDGTVRVLPSAPGASDAVVAFTAYHVIAAPIDQKEVHRQLPAGDFGAPMGASFLAWLGDRIGTAPGSLDVVLAAPGLVEAPEPELLHELTDVQHDRVARADRYRERIRVLTTPEQDGVLILGHGLAGRLEVSLELDEAARGRGLGRRLIRAARSLAPEGEMLFAQVAPGNAASLRAFLAAGFVPIGAEVLFLTRPH